MTPKEKADKLVNKFNYENKHYLALDAKKCALIAVAEIMKMPNIGYSNNKDESQYDYWQEVKQEIEKIK